MPTGGDPQRPLEGIVVLELAMHLAAPFSGALFGDLGARVIKVEPLAGDPLRTMATNENGIRATQGKESLAVDLKTTAGRDILHRLVAKSDVLIHNFRVGVPERLGADYETVRTIKPDLVYLYAGAYGSTGPNAKRAAFNPTMGALTGNSVFQSGEGNIPIGDQSADPIAGSAVGTAAMLGLIARLRTGKGQYLETTMMNSIVYCNSDDALVVRGQTAAAQPRHAAARAGGDLPVVRVQRRLGVPRRAIRQRVPYVLRGSRLQRAGDDPRFADATRQVRQPRRARRRCSSPCS